MLKIVAGLLLTGLAASAGANAPAPPKALAITGVTVLPMTGTERLADQTVLISGDRIVAVGDRRQHQGARRRDDHRAAAARC